MDFFREGSGSPDLKVDPSIWYSPRRRRQTGLVRSLLSNTPPPIDNENLPSYLREGLVTKHAGRRQDSYGIAARRPFPPSSPSIEAMAMPSSNIYPAETTVVAPIALGPTQAINMLPRGLYPDNGTLNEGMSNLKVTERSYYDDSNEMDEAFQGYEDAIITLEKRLDDTYGTRVTVGQPNWRDGRDQSGSSASWDNGAPPQLISPGSTISSSLESELLNLAMWPATPSNNTGQSSSSNVDSLPRSQTAILPTQESSPELFQHGQIGMLEPYNTQVINYGAPFNRLQPTQATRLPPVEEPNPRPRLEQIMQSHSWRANPADTAAPAPATATAAAAGPQSHVLNPPIPPAASARPQPGQPRTSPNYRGDLNNRNNQCADIPVEESTSVFIENLPGDCTVRELLWHLRGTGKVYAVSIQTPKPEKDIYTCGAKLQYWERAGVDNLFAQWAAGNFVVRGYETAVKMNWWKTPSEKPNIRSRVIIVEGPSDLVNRNRLEGLFALFFGWVTDEVIVHWQRDRRTQLEYRFASHRAQACEAHRRIAQLASHEATPDKAQHIITEGERLQWRQVSVSWGADPCA